MSKETIIRRGVDRSGYRKGYRPIVIALALTACATQPIEAQLATACNGIAAGYRTAAAYVAQGKLSPATINALVALEPQAEAVGDPTNPPTDLAAALTKAQDYLNQLALANAGVR